MKRTALIALALLTAALMAAPALSAEIAGVTVDETLQAGGRTLTLVGAGIRTKTFLKVKVYIGALYMEEPSRDPGVIVGSDQARGMVMRFLYRKVDADKLREGWREGFEANTPGAPEDLRERMERFTALFTEAATEGDVYAFIYVPGRGTEVIMNSEPRATIPGADFAGALMAVWFGEHPTDGGVRNLKESVLGQTH